MSHDFQSIAGCMAALNSLFGAEEASWGEELSALFRNHMSKPIPVEQLVESSEVLYGFREEISADAKKVAAGVVGFCTMNMWWGLAEDNRGGRMAQALTRDAGVPAPPGLSWPDESTDPSPKYEPSAPEEPEGGE